jgi:hypothetical protein
MAVVQISRIQLRRGKKNTQGLPQLASGEMAWAIDTQELYIGNGAVGEGAPAVGNTKILTENDNILDLLEQYQYKPEDSTIQSGLGVNSPTQRTLQQRLDDGAVNAASFGIVGNTTTDQTALIQNAIYSLYLTTTVPNRVALEFDPGTYNISGSIYLPSNTHIVGSGKDLTIFKFNRGGINSATAFEVAGTNVTAAGTYTNLSTVTTLGTGVGATVDITLTGVGANYTSSNTTITVSTSGSGYVQSDTIKVLGTSFVGGSSPANDLTITLDSTVPNQVFNTSTVFETINESSSRTQRNISATSFNNQAKNISLTEFTVNTNSNNVQAFNIVNVRNSNFVNVKTTGTWTTGIVTNSNAIVLTATSSAVSCQNNRFVGLHIEGFTFGIVSNTNIFNNTITESIFKRLYIGISLGQNAAIGAVGPINNTISSSLFGGSASDRIIQHGILVDKGYGNRSRGNTFAFVGGPNETTTHGQIKFTTAGNSSTQDNFDRARDLARSNLSAAYIAEIEGSSLMQETAPTVISLPFRDFPDTAIRLPLNAISGFEISYVFNSTTFGQMRKGTMYLAVDRANDLVQLVDDYEYLGAAGEDANVMFTAVVVTNAGGVKSVVVYYTNSNVGDDNLFTYTYIALS